jgi:hypothetical protein
MYASDVPVGPLRFRAPSYLDPIKDPHTLQNSSYGPTCTQVNATAECTPGGRRLGALLVSFEVDVSEDCLFLDLYVPSSAVSSPNPNVPVVVWFYGGAYVYGSKNGLGPDVPFYNGTGMLQAAAKAKSKLIFITGKLSTRCVRLAGWYADGETWAYPTRASTISDSSCSGYRTLSTLSVATRGKSAREENLRALAPSFTTYCCTEGSKTRCSGRRSCRVRRSNGNGIVKAR